MEEKQLLKDLLSDNPELRQTATRALWNLWLGQAGEKAEFRIRKGIFPFTKIRTFVFLGFFWTIARIPAILLLLLWVILQIWNSVSPEADGTAWFAHIGGFVAGVLLILPFKILSKY